MIGCVRSRITGGFLSAGSRSVSRPNPSAAGALYQWVKAYDTPVGTERRLASTAADADNGNSTASSSFPAGSLQLGDGAKGLSEGLSAAGSTTPDPAVTGAGTTETASAWWTTYSDGTVLGTIQAGLEGVHGITGLPWWATIALTTVVVKTTLFPFVVVQARHGERLGNAWPELRMLRGYLRTKLGELPPSDVKLTAEKIWYFSKGVRGVLGLHGAHPLGLVAAPLTNIPVFLAFFWGTRRMILSGTVPGLTSGGFWWFADLGYHDQTGLLPLVAVACTYASTELSMANSPSRFIQTLKDVVQSLLLVSFPFVVTLPQGVFMYWIPSSIFTGVQIVAMRNSSVRGVFGLKPYPKMHPPPLHRNAAGDTQKEATKGEEALLRRPLATRESGNTS